MLWLPLVVTQTSTGKPLGSGRAVRCILWISAWAFIGISQTNYMNWDCGVKGCSPWVVSFLDCGHRGGKEGGRPAHIHAVLLQRRATRPHRCCVAAKEGESPSLLYSRIEDEPFCIL
jgi:hypothetical protein